MSFYYINYVSFKKNGDVTVRVADSSLRPLTYHTVKGWNLNEEKWDIHKWLKDFAVSVRNGNYQIVGSGCKTLVSILEAVRYLRNRTYDFSLLLKDDDFGEFVADYVENSKYAIDKFNIEFSIAYAKETLVDNVSRWIHLPEEFRNNVELAKFYVENCADVTLFHYPECLLTDREYALKAVKAKGVNFRQLYDVWNNDEDIVYAAFSNKLWPEHLPDLIGSDLLHNKDFVKKVIIAEPKLHWDRFPRFLKEDPEVIEWLTQYNVWHQSELKRKKGA